MKVPKEVKKELEKIPELMLNLAKQAVVFAENMTRASTFLQEELNEMEVEQ